jgi:hypothetical protein
VKGRNELFVDIGRNAANAAGHGSAITKFQRRFAAQDMMSGSG